MAELRPLQVTVALNEIMGRDEFIRLAVKLMNGDPNGYANLVGAYDDGSLKRVTMLSWLQHGIVNQPHLAEVYKAAMARLGDEAQDTRGDTGLGTGGDTGKVTGGPVLPIVTPGEIEGERRERLPFGTQYSPWLDKVARGYGSPVQAYLEEQEEPLGDLFDLAGLTGQLKGSTEATGKKWLAQDFLNNLGGVAGIGKLMSGNPFQEYLDKGITELADPAESDFQEYLHGKRPNENYGMGQERQFQLALRSALPDMAPVARPYFESRARRAFKQFRYNTPGDDFLTYYHGRGRKFFD